MKKIVLLSFLLSVQIGMAQKKWFNTYPYVYGYMQFKQFIEIYEDKNLPDFDTFIKTTY